MFGNKLRSWMEAVRPRKKQQRKEKQAKNLTNPNSTIVTNFKTVPNSQSSENEMGNVDSKSMQTIASQGARYSGANLSSPESAYSTGYSTDGTSPGAPPEYYINIRTGTRYFPSETDKCSLTQSGNHVTSNPQTQGQLQPAEATNRVPSSLSSRTQPTTRANLSPQGDRDRISSARTAGTTTTTAATVHLNSERERGPISVIQEYDNNTQARTGITLQNNLNSSSNGVCTASTRLTVEVATAVNSGITSPRQRNRIRTNPWVPGNNLSPGNSCVGLHTRQDMPTPRASLMSSPIPARYSSPTVSRGSVNRTTQCDSLSSSSCSSLSASSLHWDASLVRDGISGLIGRNARIHSASDEEDDCTLNEMMGKYDESYIYEKETDILSDSDPTDCEDTDIDTGQDGGDEDDPLETEFDFIDNGSFLDFNIKDERNTGHCTYYNFEAQRKCSRRRASKRSTKDALLQGKPCIERRRRSTSSKKRHRDDFSKTNMLHSQDGTRSAGATPLSARKTKAPVSKLALEDRLRKRSNSVSFQRDPAHFFDQRDKEADKKYKELIVEAEHILMNMKSSGLSPRRVPGPANKRVELLRTENTKPDVFMKNRLIEDVSNLHVSRIPSNFSPRFSPKRNHITNFMNNNSPILLKRDMEKEARHTPLVIRKEPIKNPNSPLMRRKQPKTDLPSRRSPKYRKKLPKGKQNDSLSSDSEGEQKPKHNIIMRNSKYNSFSCPQSEPVKRKVYSNQCKAVAFNLVYETGFTHTEEISVVDERGGKSCENLRQQVLLTTITNLKRNLEDQSASLKQVYRSSQNLQN